MQVKTEKFSFFILEIKNPLLIALMILVWLLSSNLSVEGQVVVSTYAGNGSFGSTDGLGINAKFGAPGGVAVDASGNVFVADYGNGKIRKISPSGVVSTFAGSGLFGSQDGIGTNATFSGPIAITIDVNGNLYVADRDNHKIRKITPSGIVSTLAGSGSVGSVDAIGTAASFNTPSGIAVDGIGNVYVADLFNHKIRKISPSGSVVTLAGSVGGYADGIGANAKFLFPFGIAADALGNVYVGDANNRRIRKISTGGMVSTIAGSGLQGSADGQDIAASFEFVYGLTVDVSGNLYLTDYGQNKIRKVSSVGEVTTLAGSGIEGSSDGIGLVASFNKPIGIAVDRSGNLFIADYLNNKVRKIVLSCSIAAPIVSTIHPTCATPTGTIQVLSPISFYEYSIDGSVYQSSPIFNNISPAINHTITSRRQENISCISDPVNVPINSVPTLPPAPVVSVTVQPTAAIPTGTIMVTSPLSFYEYSLDGGIYQASTIFDLVTPGLLHTVKARSLIDVSCISPESPVLIGIDVRPTVVSPIIVCQGSSNISLTATGIDLKWYASASGGIGSSIAPIPSSLTLGSTSYYVTQTINGIESSRAEIIFTVSPNPSTPISTSPINLCKNSFVNSLTAEGTDIRWYAENSVSGSLIAPIPSTALEGASYYYVTQTINGCESVKSQIQVNVLPIPNPVNVSNVSYCEGSNAIPLLANVLDLNWYSSPSGTVATTIAPIPNTNNVGISIYYVSQNLNNCESERSAIVVNVIPNPPAPTVVNTINYCQNAVADVLSVEGMNLTWYSTLNGVSGSSVAPIVSTAVIGSTYYYVSQAFQGCESAKSIIKVEVTAAPPAPIVTSPVNFCIGNTPNSLFATGNELQWYSPFNACTASSIAPVPSTLVQGNSSYFVSQKINGCESNKSEIIVQVNETAPAPIVISPLNLFVNSSPTALTALGVNLIWYTTSNGGVGSTVAPVPSTLSAGNFDYYVTQTIGGCESPRALIHVKVTSDINVPSCFALGGTYQIELSPSYTLNASQYSWWVNGSIQSINPINSTNSFTTISVGQYYSGGQVCVGINYNQSPWYKQVCVNVDLCSPNAKIISEPLSLQQNDDNMSVKIYPNPFKEEVIIETIKPIHNIEIVSVLGVIVQRVDEIKVKQVIVWNSLISSGLYIVRYTNERGEQQQLLLEKE